MYNIYFPVIQKIYKNILSVYMENTEICIIHILVLVLLSVKYYYYQ